MSKYTTEVRFICEEAAGLKKSAGYNDVNEIVNTAYPKIFDSSLQFYNDETKVRLLPKILLHYYTKEIGFETVGLWKLKLNQKMREILPYYNQLYASEDLEYDPFKNVDNIHTHTGEYEDKRGGSNRTITSSTENKDFKETRNLQEAKDFTETKNLTESRNLTETRNLQTVDDGSSSYDHNEDVILRHDKTTTHGQDETSRDNDTTSRTNDTVTHSIDGDRDHWVMYSDTPQGGIDGVQSAGGTSYNGSLGNNAYLTNATHETERPAASHDTTQYGTITNTFGKVTNKFGDVTESYNKNGDKSDHTDADGWDKTDNTNTQTGTIGSTGTIGESGTDRNAGTTTNTGTIRNAGTTTDNGTTTNEKDEQDTGTDAYTKTETGKIGVISYQEMLMKHRETFLNIDLQIIMELDDLFMKVW